MNTLLKTVLIILLVYFGFKFLFKFAKPYIMRYIAKKAGQQFEKAFKGATQRNGSPQQEGEVTIDKNASSKTTSKSTVGEYVDYEEID